MPTSYIVALITSLCLIFYKIFGSEEKLWQINCEGILHGTCVFSWCFLILGNSWLSLILSSIIGIVVSAIAYLYIKEKTKHYHSDFSKGNTEEFSPIESISKEDFPFIGKFGNITLKTGKENQYIGILEGTNESIMITIIGTYIPKINDRFQVKKVVGMDIIAEIVKKAEE